MPELTACRVLTYAYAGSRFTDMQTKLIGSRDATALLGIDRSTFLRLVQAGKLIPVSRVSDTLTGALLFARTDVERLAKDRNKAS